MQREQKELWELYQEKDNFLNNILWQSQIPSYKEVAEIDNQKYAAKIYGVGVERQHFCQYKLDSHLPLGDTNSQYNLLSLV